MSSYDDHEEESFFVSMTDIMVGLLFIFLMVIMYFAIQSKVDQETIEKQKKNIASLTDLINQYGDLKLYSELTAYQIQVASQRTYLLRWVNAHMTANGVDGAEIIEDQGVIRLPEGILFDSGEFSFQAGSDAEKTAISLALALEEVLPCSVFGKNGEPYRSRRECENNIYHNSNNSFVQAVYIEGHTDSAKIIGALPGDPKITSNLKLAARRSTNTFETMTSAAPSIIEFSGPVAGEEVLRFQPILASTAYGEWRPAASNVLPEGRRANRRIDVRIVMYQPPNIEALSQLAAKLGQTMAGLNQ